MPKLNAARHAITEARRKAALSRLSLWTNIAPSGALAATIGTFGFKTVAKVAMHATAAHGFILGDTGPVAKDTLTHVAANALRSLTATSAETVYCNALKMAGYDDSTMIHAHAVAMLAARLADGESVGPIAEEAKAKKAKKAAPLVLSDRMVEVPIQRKVEVAPVPLPPVTVEDGAEELKRLAAQSGDPGAGVFAAAVIGGASINDAIAIAAAASGGDTATVAASVEKAKKRGKPVAPKQNTPEWEEVAKACPAMRARPEANWQPASVVFGMKGLKGYVEVVASSHPNVPAVDPDFVFNRPILERVVASLSGGQGSIPLHLWCWGERGTGKTTLVEQLAARLGRPFFKVTFTRHTDAAEIIGQTGLKDGNTYWTDGSILSALRCGDAPIILLDEFTLAQSGNISGPINEIVHPLCKYHVPQTGEVVRYDPRTWFVVGDNTNGSGDATGRYTDTRQANRATVDRFAAFVRINRLTDGEETRLIAARASVDEGLAARTQEVLKVLREKCDTGALADPPSMREAIAFASLMRSGLLKAQDAFESAFAGKYPPEAQEEMRSTFTAAWKADASEGAAVSHPLNHVEPDEDTPV